MKLTQFLRLSMLTVAAIVIAIAANSVFSQPQTPPTNAALTLAVQLIRNGENEKAIDQLKKAVKKNKTDGEAWYYLGIAYLQVSDFKKASDAFQKAIEMRSDLAAPSHAGYAYALVLRNRFATAVGEANKALAIDPKNIEALYTLAIVDLRTGKREEAVKRADAMIALKPDFAAAYLLKCQAFVGYSGGVVYPNPSESNDERRVSYASAAEALEKYLQLETDPRAAESWQEQLQTLKFFLADKSVRGDIYVGRNVTTKARLTAKPEPTYTEWARQAQIEGTVVLKCVFASDGTIKHILVVQALPNGLTEQAVAAAKKIRFIPATVDGKPVSMWMQLEYNFNLY